MASQPTKHDLALELVMNMVYAAGPGIEWVLLARALVNNGLGKANDVRWLVYELRMDGHLIISDTQGGRGMPVYRIATTPAEVSGWHFENVHRTNRHIGNMRTYLGHAGAALGVPQTPGTAWGDADAHQHLAMQYLTLTTYNFAPGAPVIPQPAQSAQPVPRRVKVLKRKKRSV